MIDPQQEEIQTLVERAKEYYKTVESEILSFQREDKVLIVGLDPKEKKYWIGETESEVIGKKEKDGNKNLIYFIKLPTRSNSKEKFLVASL
jgi:lysyl-tRNA synthetase class I